MSHIRVQIQAADFCVDDVYCRVRDVCGAKLGAVASFVGLVRDRNKHTSDTSAVATLTLEHYPGMTERSIEAIAKQACKRWPILALEVIHRVGEMTPTEQIVLVMVGSGHRDAAFAAAEFVMDYLKTDAVLWKREVTQQGDHWVQSTGEDHERAKRWK